MVPPRFSFRYRNYEEIMETKKSSVIKQRSCGNIEHERTSIVLSTSNENYYHVTQTLRYNLIKQFKLYGTVN